ncbi:MAG: glycosyltransferase family 4 protein [Candidatus Thorarchaeota archaeon]
MDLNKRPKIGIITKPIDQGTSGSSMHLLHLVEYILKLNEKFNIILIHYNKNANEIYKNANEIIIPKNPLLASIRLKKENFDLIHFSPLNILSPIWLKKTKKVATIHGGGGSQLLLPHLYGKLKLFRTKVVKPYLAKKMDHIFTGSKISKQLISSRYSFDKTKINLTYSAVDDDFRIFKNKPIDTEIKLGINTPFIFHLSKFSGRKNPWTILKAFQILRERNKDISLVIGGSGWKNKEVIEYIKKSKIEENVIFTGFISREDVIKLLNLAKIFIFPSLFEGFGIPNLEAMACGCPVITSNVFAIPEIVGDAALILKDNKDPVELADKVIEILEDEYLQKSLIQKGLERIKLYSWRASAKIVLDTYEKSLEN